MKYHKEKRYYDWSGGTGLNRLVFRSVFTQHDGIVAIEEPNVPRRNVKRQVYDNWKFEYISCGLSCDLNWNGVEE